MIVSMTGYGRTEREQDLVRITVEMKSVNHRFCEIVVRLPKAWNTLEDQVRKAVAPFVKRGRVDVTISIEPIHSQTNGFQINWELAGLYAQAAREMNERFSLQTPIAAKDLLSLSGVVSTGEAAVISVEDMTEVLPALVEETAKEMLLMKQREGSELQKDLFTRVMLIEQWTREMQGMTPEAAEQYRVRLRQRAEELAEQISFDEQRLLQEVVLFAERADISEELTRLQSHCAQFSEQLVKSEAVGRKLDFLLQEMNREANTIASKANYLPIQHLAVEVKTELEKMREQVQNIE